MTDDAKETHSYSSVKERLDAIAEQVKAEDVSLDDALDLYEEAVKLAMKASELIEIDEEPEEAGEDVADAIPSQPASGSASDISETETPADAEDEAIAPAVGA